MASWRRDAHDGRWILTDWPGVTVAEVWRIAPCQWVCRVRPSGRSGTYRTAREGRHAVPTLLAALDAAPEVDRG